MIIYKLYNNKHYTYNNNALISIITYLYTILQYGNTIYEFIKLYNFYVCIDFSAELNNSHRDNIELAALKPKGV